MKRNGVFHGICVDKLLLAEPRKKRMLMNTLNKGIKNGYVKPLDRLCFKGNELEKAYKHMADGKHLGKVLINICEEKVAVSNTPFLKKLTDAIPRLVQTLLFGSHRNSFTGNALVWNSLRTNYTGNISVAYFRSKYIYSNPARGCKNFFR